MKRTSIALVAIILILCSTSVTYGDQKVLLILKDGSHAMDLMLTQEIAVMTSLLKEAGYVPIVGTESGLLLKGASASVKPDLRLADVSIQDYVGILVPCMANGFGNGVAPQGVSLVKQAFDRGVPIAAEQGGVEFLGKAGILKGKHFAISADGTYLVPDGIYSGTMVTTDGKIATAGVCPYRATPSSPATTEALTKRFIQLLKASPATPD